MLLLRHAAMNLLIGLTAAGVLVQPAWAFDCVCGMAVGEAPAGCQATEETGCCRAKQVEPSCCQQPVLPRGCRAAGAERAGSVCQCGPSCQCAESDAPPTPPATTGTQSSSAEPLVVQAAAVQALTHDAGTADFLADSTSAFAQPGTQYCVLLCRFML